MVKQTKQQENAIKSVTVTFNDNLEPIFVFTGIWSVQDFSKVRNTFYRAYKHHIKTVRNQEGLK